MKKNIANILVALIAVASCSKTDDVKLEPGTIIGSVRDLERTKAAFSDVDRDTESIQFEVGDEVKVYEKWNSYHSYTYVATKINRDGTVTFKGEPIPLGGEWMVRFPADDMENRRVQVYQGPGKVPTNQYMEGMLIRHRFVLESRSVLHIRVTGNGTIGRIRLGDTTELLCDQGEFSGGVTLTPGEVKHFYLSMQGTYTSTHAYPIIIYNTDGKVIYNVSQKLEDYDINRCWQNLFYEPPLITIR